MNTINIHDLDISTNEKLVQFLLEDPIVLVTKSEFGADKPVKKRALLLTSKRLLNIRVLEKSGPDSYLCMFTPACSFKLQFADHASIDKHIRQVNKDDPELSWKGHITDDDIDQLNKLGIPIK